MIDVQPDPAGVDELVRMPGALEIVRGPPSCSEVERFSALDAQLRDAVTADGEQARVDVVAVLLRHRIVHLQRVDRLGISAERRPLP